MPDGERRRPEPLSPSYNDHFCVQVLGRSTAFMKTSFDFDRETALSLVSNGYEYFTDTYPYMAASEIKYIAYRSQNCCQKNQIYIFQSIPSPK